MGLNYELQTAQGELRQALAEVTRLQKEVNDLKRARKCQHKYERVCSGGELQMDKCTKCGYEHWF